MAVSIHDYLIDHSGFDWNKLFVGWEWLLPPEFTVWLMNRFGDLFLVTPDGTVHMLDVAVGTLTKLAESRADFSTRVDEGDNAGNWFFLPLVDRLVSAGMGLQPGQCYGFKLPPVLGGQYAVENVAVFPVAITTGPTARSTGSSGTCPTVRESY
jgi:hypothetical protein